MANDRIVDMPAIKSFRENMDARTNNLIKLTDEVNERIDNLRKNGVSSASVDASASELANKFNELKSEYAKISNNLNEFIGESSAAINASNETMSTQMRG